MNIQPASIDQIRSGSDGRVHMIDRDVGNVAADLKAIDPCLKVRFAENGNPPFWAVYWESPDGRDTYLVTTAKAFQTSVGIWTGLDQRLVERIRSIDPANGYDYAGEIEKIELERRANAKREFQERTSEGAEKLAHAFRKDLGYKGRAFISKKEK